MRARSSVEFARLLVVVLVLASGCSPDEGPVAVEALEPVPPQPAANPAPRPALDLPREAGPAPSPGRDSPFGVNVHATGADDIGDVATPVLRRLVYQCTDEMTFAVRTVGNRLEVFPPGVSRSYVVLTRVPSDSGVRYTAPNAYFRGNGDLATLQIGREHYVDCVSNPAAAVWGTVQLPSGTR
jgi:membrane-bound inhibitor of C-type lysozyme